MPHPRPHPQSHGPDPPTQVVERYMLKFRKKGSLAAAAAATQVAMATAAQAAPKKP